MAKDAKLNRTGFFFTAPNERADAIALVAAEYPAEQIEAEVTAIRNPEDATAALAKVIMRTQGAWYDLFEADQNRVAERYTELGDASRQGKAGKFSAVELQVPYGAQNFDWETFYQGVEAYL